MTDSTEPVLDMDDLLATPIPETTPVETVTQRRIRELQEELERPAPVIVVEKFKSEAELTEEERTLRALEDKVVRKRTAEADAAPVRYADQGEGESILLHFLEDGFTTGGVVWYRGQEVEYVIGSQAHKQQLDRNGNSWLDLVSDVPGQYKRWGKQFFAAGEWPGREWDDFSHLSDPEEIRQAEAAAAAERRRGRKPPLAQ